MCCRGWDVLQEVSCVEGVYCVARKQGVGCVAGGESGVCCRE